MSLLANLKDQMSDKEKIIIWLNIIEETDQDCINEVIDQCSKDKEARKYYVSRYEGIKNEQRA